MTYRSFPRLSLALTAAAAFSGSCGGEQAAPSADSGASSPSTAAAPAAPSLETASSLGVPNVRMSAAGVLTAGQPSNEQLDALAAAGYTRFISLRPAGENGAGWEEADAAAHAHDFDRLAIAGAGDLTRENVEAFAALLDEAGAAPTVVYCASGNRVGAMLALKAAWVDGMAPEEALRLGLDSGMTRLEAPVRELLGLAGSD